jgi:hypothetical protein
MTMTPLAKLLSSLDAMLDTEDAPAAAEANVEIWEYLSAFDGISAQTQAINELASAFATRPADSTFHEMVRRQIAQHQRRLAGE